MVVFIDYRLCFLPLGVDGQCVYDSVFPFVPVNGFRNYQQLSRNVEDGSSPPINIPDGVVFGDKVVNTAYVRCLARVL